MKNLDWDDPRNIEPEYDFSHGTRGKFAGRSVQGAIAVLIDPDLTERFPTSEAVNAALRSVIVRDAE